MRSSDAEKRLHKKVFFGNNRASGNVKQKRLFQGFGIPHCHEWKLIPRLGRQCQTCGKCQIRVAGMWSIHSGIGFPEIAKKVEIKEFQKPDPSYATTATSVTIKDVSLCTLSFNGSIPHDIFKIITNAGFNFSKVRRAWMMDKEKVPEGFLKMIENLFGNP